MDFDALARGYQPIQLKKPQQGKSKDFFTDQISTVGGILGGVVGLPLGLLGAAGGSAVGSGLGEGLENLITGEDASKNVLQEALLGGVLGAGPLRLGGAAFSKIAPRAGQSLESAGGRLMGTQANLTRAEARKLGATPAQTYGEINKRTGLTKARDIQEVAGNVTGESGALSELTRNAIGNSPGIDISGMTKRASDLLTDLAPNVPHNIRKNVLDQVQSNVTRAYGGSKGSLNTLASPLETFDAIRSFEGEAASLLNRATVTSADAELAKFYKTLAKEMKDQLFAAPGVQEGLNAARGGAASTFRNLASTAPRAQRGAYERLAGETEGITDIGQLRSAQAPFVQFNKMDQATARAQNGAAAQLGDNMQGLGKVLQRPTNIAAMPLNAATPFVGGKMAQAGRALQGGGTPQTMGGIVRNVGAGGLLTNTGTPGDAGEMSLEESVMGAAGGQGFGQDPSAMQPQSQSPYPRENLMYDIQRDPEHADEYFKQYQMYQELFGTQQPKLSATQQSTAARAQNALGDVDVVAQAIESGDIDKGLIPFNDNALVSNALGTGGVNAALYNLGDVILRSRTGAVAPPEEVRKFIAGYLPRAGEDRETKLYKLQRAQQELMGMLNPSAALGGVGTSNPLEEALMGAY